MHGRRIDLDVVEEILNLLPLRCRGNKIGSQCEKHHDDAVHRAPPHHHRGSQHDEIQAGIIRRHGTLGLIDEPRDGCDGRHRDQQAQWTHKLQSCRRLQRDSNDPQSQAAEQPHRQEGFHPIPPIDSDVQHRASRHEDHRDQAADLEVVRTDRAFVFLELPPHIRDDWLLGVIHSKACGLRGKCSLLWPPPSV